VVPDFERLKSGNIANITDPDPDMISRLWAVTTCLSAGAQFRNSDGAASAHLDRKLKRFEIFLQISIAGQA